MKKKIFLKFKKGEQKLFLEKAIKKAGSKLELSKLSNIPNSSIYSYKNEIHPLTLERTKSLAKFLKLDFNKIKKQVKDIYDIGWDKNEINFLKENYLDMTAKEIASKLNKTVYSVKHMRRKLNLKKGAAYRWKKNKIINTFRGFVKKIGRTPTYQECVEEHPGMITAIHRNWGKYSEFLRYLGLQTKIRCWTKKDCIKEFEKLRNKKRSTPSIDNLKECKGLFKAIRKRWKSYNNFLRELGYTPNFELKWSREKCLEEFIKIMSNRKNLLTVEELLKLNPALVAAVYKYFKSYPNFVRLAGYKYDDRWQKWEKLVIKICKKIYPDVKVKPKLENNKQPDVVIMKNNFFEKIIDAKLNSFAHSIRKDIKNYGSYCNKLEFWCLIGRKKFSIDNVEIINSQKIKRILKQRNEFDLIKKVEAMERLCY